MTFLIATTLVITYARVLIFTLVLTLLATLTNPLDLPSSELQSIPMSPVPCTVMRTDFFAQSGMESDIV